MSIYYDGTRKTRIIVAILFLLFAHYPQLGHAADLSSADANTQKFPSEPDCRFVMCPPVYDGPIDDKMNKCCKPVILKEKGEKDLSTTEAITAYSCRCIPGCDLCCGSGSQGCTVCGCSSCKEYVCDKASAKMLDSFQTEATKTQAFYLTGKQYEELQGLQKSFSAKGAQAKKCHIEYRNCWIDYEYRCYPSGGAGGGVHCEQVPVRRCGKPETVCD